MSGLSLKKIKIITCIALAVMALGSVGLDQVTKSYAQSELMTYSDENDLSRYSGQRIPVVAFGDDDRMSSQFYLSFGLNYVRNLGAAWGALSTLPDAIRVPFFYLVTIVAVIIIGLYMKNTPWEHRLARFSLVLILSGAIGNFIDRVVYGYVIDWIDVRWNIFSWRYNFPNFNVADSAITVGVACLMVDMLIFEGRRQAELDKSKEVASAG
jgi:signal peptidase II